MVRIHNSNDSSGRIVISFPYDPALVSEIYTHISMKDLGKIMSPLDTLELAKGGEE